MDKGPKEPLRAFTLVELLVVIGIIALLIGVLLSALVRAQESARGVKCMSNLRSIGQGLLNYTVDNSGRIIPAYNLPPLSTASNYTASAGQPLDGWACILDRDRYVAGSAQQSLGCVFCCPDTLDIAGLAAGATGANAADPRGWVDWPMVFLGPSDTSPKQPLTIPSQGFNKIIRVGYWINAYHPTGQTLAPLQVGQKDLYYSTVVGYGGVVGQRLQAHRMNAIRHTTQTITVADGLFMGRQVDDQAGMLNCVIGYRHRGPHGPQTAANVAFADGHVETLTAAQFPCAFASTASYQSSGGTTTLALQQAANGSGATVYLDAATALAQFLLANPGVQ